METNAYKSVCEGKPYGEKVTIIKLECISHMQKRMGTFLHDLKVDIEKTKTFRCEVTFRKIPPDGCCCAEAPNLLWVSN